MGKRERVGWRKKDKPAKFTSARSPLNRHPMHFANGEQTATEGSATDNVLTALSTLPELLFAQRLDIYDPRFLKGINIVASIDRRRIAVNFESVDIRVTYGERRIRTLREDIAQADGLTESEVDERLARERLMLLNGKLGETSIQREFIGQLYAIDKLRNSPKS